MSIRTRVGNIEIVDRGEGGAAVTFPRSQEMNASLKAVFPRCRWNKVSRVWDIPGKQAASRALIWANACVERLHELEPAAALAHRRQDIIGGCSIDGAKISYGFPYSAEAVAIARALPGARFDSHKKSWSFEPWCLADVDKLITGFNQIAGLAEAARERAKVQEQAEIAQQSRRRAAIRRIERMGEKSDLDAAPAGEIIWQSRSEPLGQRSVVLVEDGSLWLVVSLGAAAITFSNPSPSKTICGYRVIATPELIAAISP